MSEPKRITEERFYTPDNFRLQTQFEQELDRAAMAGIQNWLTKQHPALAKKIRDGHAHATAALIMLEGRKIIRSSAKEEYLWTGWLDEMLTKDGQSEAFIQKFKGMMNEIVGEKTVV